VSDQDQPAPGEPSFDDPAFDDLRGMLADARVTEPTPPDVVARLESALGSLRDQRRAEADRPSASVLLLRRRVGRVLVAAAAAVVVAAGSYGIVHSGGNGSSNSDTAASGAGGQANAEKAAPSVATPGLSHLSTHGVVLRRAHFARDAATLMRTLAAADVADSLDAVPSATPPVPAASPGTGDYAANGSVAGQAPPVTSTPTTADDAKTLRAPDRCSGPATPGAVTIEATLDGVPVALVFRPPTPSAQVVEAWSCDGATLLASATVPR